VSMYPEDLPQELFYDEIRKNFLEGALEDWEVYERVVDDFKEARLKDYYLEHPNVIEGPLVMLDEARNLLSSNPRASLVLGFAAGEVGLHNGILAPILHGCFHAESAANLLVNLIVRAKNDRFTKALFKVLADVIQVDVETFSRSGSKVSLWEEFSIIQKIRNKVLHQAEIVADGKALLAITISETILNDIFNGVLKKLELHLHAGTHVCGSRACPSSQEKT